jgi:putative transcriptional regulator
MTKQTPSRTRHGDDGRAAETLIEEDIDMSEVRTDWARLEAMTGEEALQNALNDPDSLPLTPEQCKRLRRVPNPQKIRQDMGLTQEQFARRFEIALGTLRDWEQGVRIPDSTAKAYLRAIENDPEAIVRALEASYSRSH